MGMVPRSVKKIIDTEIVGLLSVKAGKVEEIRMILVIDTTRLHGGTEIIQELKKAGSHKYYERIDTTDLNISHCIGCNCCWLKTPGICVIKDDYEQILVKMIEAEQIWLIADTKYGFVSYQAKNIIDRIMPMVTMYLKMKKGQMRHVMRYRHTADFGVVYYGEADANYLKHWSERVALNLGSNSLGAYNEWELKEAVSCML